MSNAHTPGPWHVGEPANLSDQVFTSNGVIIADCKWTARTPTQRKANAALIARAPELLAEVERLRAAITAVLERSGGSIYHTDQETGETFDALLRAALAGEP